MSRSGRVALIATSILGIVAGTGVIIAYSGITPVSPYCVGERWTLHAGVNPPDVYAEADPSPAFTIGGKSYLHPVLWAQTAQALIRDGREADARRLADELWAHAEDGWLAYDYDWPETGNTAPWYSAMAQGEALHSFTLLGMDDRADAMFATLADKRIVNEDGWLMEYPGYPPVLNGALFAVGGLYAYWESTESAEARRRLVEAIQPVIADLHLFRNPGAVSSYETADRIRNPVYHAIHVKQISWLAAVTGLSCLNVAADDFDADA